ncbi:MAG TPA: carbon storage regulator [Gemmataceae bacterium]|nr:carbon storage regulator [Gemmataceae bacterium]
MLVLSRKPGEKVVIGGCITITVVEVDGRRVKLAFDAPSDVHILRAELAEWHDRPAAVHEVPVSGRSGRVPDAAVRPDLIIKG